MELEQLRNTIRGAFDKTYEHTVFDLPIEPKFESLGCSGHGEVDAEYWKHFHNDWSALGFWRWYGLGDVEKVLMRMRPEDITGRIEESFIAFYLDKINSVDNYLGLKNKEELKKLGYFNEFFEEDAHIGHHNDYPLFLEFCQKVISEKGYEQNEDAAELYKKYCTTLNLGYLVKAGKHKPIGVGLFFSCARKSFGVYASTMRGYASEPEVSFGDVVAERLETYPLKVLKDPEAMERIAEHVAFNAPFTRKAPEAMKKKMPQRGPRP